MDSGRFMQIGLFHEDRERSRKLIERIKPVSIIIMGNDFKNLEDLKNLIKWINSIYNKELKINSPLIAIDQEGGNVARIREINYPPSNYALGRINSEKISYYSGAITGSELYEIGIEWDLAPVLDVLSNKENASILERSFGENVEIVSRNGVAFIKGLQDFGVAATAKHFPGNGSVQEDPHEKLPVDKRNIHSIKNTMIPFMNAIRWNVKSIMVSHVLFREIDPDFPSSLSEKIYEMLRNDLNYGGLIITDSLDMKAISMNYSPEEIAKFAFQNGADILECVDPILAEEIHEHLKKISSDNTMKKERFLSLRIKKRKKFVPPPEVMQWLSSSVPRWVRKAEINPDKIFYIYYSGTTTYMVNIVEKIVNRLKELGFNVEKYDLFKKLKNSQIIIIGKNLHLNGNYSKINEICKDNKCIFINTGVPFDSSLLEENIGYVAAMGDKYENIISSIYSLLGLYDFIYY